MLRIKKPQPASLSAFISKRVRVRQSRVSVLAALQDYHLPLARQEEAWDNALKAEFGIDWEGDTPDQSWRSSVTTATMAVEGYMKAEVKKSSRYARKMQEIVEQEKALASAEKQVRKGGRRVHERRALVESKAKDRSHNSFESGVRAT